MKLTRLVVDLGALCANYRYIAEAVPRLGAVVKADGYGLGAAAVTQALAEEGCEDFFVATPEEGAALRTANKNVRICVFSGPYDQDSADSMAQAGLTPVLNDLAQIERWRPHRRLPVAVHVDTGMNRLGFPSATVVPDHFEGLDVCLLLSHLANADDPGASGQPAPTGEFPHSRQDVPRRADQPWRFGPASCWGHRRIWVEPASPSTAAIHSPRSGIPCARSPPWKRG